MGRNLAKPMVSVIVPTYNSARTLSECLKSVCEQTYPHHETIVVDNFSNDDTLGISQRFGAKTIQLKCNPALARNVGATSCTGQYVLFLDSDQILSARVIEECVNLCTTESVGMIRIPEVFAGKDFWSSCSSVWKNHYEKVEQLHSISTNVIHGEPRFYNKEQIVRVGMFDEEVLFGEDYLLHEKMRKSKVREALCRSTIYHCEFASVKEILIKDLRYGKSMLVFLKQTGKPVLSWMLRHTILTFIELIRNKKPPTIIVGCAALVWLKTCTIVIGLVSRTDYSGAKR